MVGIVILNYNTWQLTVDFVKSIIDNCKSNYKIYIVDNGSANDSYDQLAGLYGDAENIDLIRMPKNIGYSNGMNAGARKAMSDGCDYLLLSNNDVLFYYDVVAPMEEYMKNNKSVGLLTVQEEDKDRNCKDVNLLIRNRDWKYTFFLEMGTRKFFKKSSYEKYTISAKDVKAPKEIFWYVGFCYMVNSEQFKEIGMLDEELPLYQEESVLSYKYKKQGYKIMYLPDLSMVHLGGQSTKLSVVTYRELIYSRLFYLKKYENVPDLLIWLEYYLKVFYGKRTHFSNARKEFSKMNMELKKRVKDLVHKY